MRKGKFVIKQGIECPNCGHLNKECNEHYLTCVNCEIELENDAVAKLHCSDGLDRIADKFKKYFCMSNTCSDSDNKQHPDCQIEHCLYRDRIVEDLIEIIRNAD